MPGQYSGHTEDNSKSFADFKKDNVTSALQCWKTLLEMFNQQKSTLLEMIEQIGNYTHTIHCVLWKQNITNATVHRHKGPSKRSISRF